MITTSDILKFNPYDIEFRSLPSIEKSKREDFFFDNLFVETKAFKKHRLELLGRINPQSSSFNNIVILHGYSGNGKTTFLHWFKRNLSSEFFFDIININDFPASSKENVIHKAIFVKIKELVDNEFFLSIEYYKKYSKLSRSYLNVSQIEYLDKFNEFMREKKEALNDGNIEMEDIQKKLKLHFENFEKIFDFENALFLFFLEIIVRNNSEEIKSFTVCFDNLDEISFEYMTEKLWNDFLQVRSNLIEFFNDDAIVFEFPKRVVFLLVFREANLLVNAAHQEERIDSKGFKLLLSDNSKNKPSSGKKIIEQRLSYLRRTRNINKDNVYKVANTIIKESYTNRVFLPLFNYDYRKLMNMVIEIAEPEYSNSQEVLYPRLYLRIKKTSPYIARGLFFHRIINYLLVNGYIKELAKKPDQTIVKNRGFCRPSRLLLTIIFRLSYPRGLPLDEYMLHLEKPEKITLFSVVKDYFGIYSDVDSFFKDLSLLFNIKEGSWAHLVSIYNKEINANNNFKFDFSEESLIIRRWKEGDVSDFELNKFLTDKKKIQLHINASGYIYLRYLITHFEYFVILNNYRKGINKKSLVETFLSLEYNHSAMKFEFEILVMEIINKLRRYKGNICNFLNNVVVHEKKISPIDYLNKTNYSFARSEEHAFSFYLTRVVTTHVSYLEELRRFMFFGAKKRITKRAQQYNSSIKDLNLILIKLIEMYLNILEETKVPVYDQIAKQAILKTGERVSYVKKSNLYVWTPIIESNTGGNNVYKALGEW